MTSETASYFLHTLGVGSEPIKAQASPSPVQAKEIPGNTPAALVVEESPHGTYPSGESLLERLGEGDKEALGILFRRYARQSLYFFEGYTLAEIAARMGQTVGNVRNHYYRALEKMRKHIFVSNLGTK